MIATPVTNPLHPAILGDTMLCDGTRSSLTGKARGRFSDPRSENAMCKRNRSQESIASDASYTILRLTHSLLPTPPGGGEERRKGGDMTTRF